MTTSTENKRVRSVEEAAGELDVHPLTLRRAIARGDIAAVKIGRRVLIPVAALDEFLASRPSAATGRRE